MGVLRVVLVSFSVSLAQIKPANVLLNSWGEVKLADFGILGKEEDSLKTFCGTTTFMSPERLKGGGYTLSGDIWSLGLVLLVCATGRFPYEFDKSGGYWAVCSAICDADPPALPASAGQPLLADLIAHCLARHPADRWTAEQLLAHPYFDLATGADAELTQWPSLHGHDANRTVADLADLRTLIMATTDSLAADAPATRLAVQCGLAAEVAAQLGIDQPELAAVLEQLLGTGVRPLLLTPAGTSTTASPANATSATPLDTSPAGLTRTPSLSSSGSLTSSGGRIKRSPLTPGPRPAPELANALMSPKGSGLFGPRRDSLTSNGSQRHPPTDLRPIASERDGDDDDDDDDPPPPSAGPDEAAPPPDAGADWWNAPQ